MSIFNMIGLFLFDRIEWERHALPTISGRAFRAITQEYRELVAHYERLGYQFEPPFAEDAFDEIRVAYGAC